MRLHGRAHVERCPPDDVVTAIDSYEAGRSLVEGLVDAVLVIDRDSRIVELNAAARRLFLIPEGVTPAVLDELLPAASADLHRTLVHHFDDGRPAARSMSDRAGVPARRWDGSQFTAGVSISKWRPPGHEPMLVAVVRDLSEWRQLQRSSEQLAHLVTGILETTEAELAVIDEGSRVVTANAAFRRQFLAGADPTGMLLSELAGNDPREGIRDVLDVVDQVLTHHTEVEVFTRDGGVPAEHWFHVTATPLPAHAGVVLSARDVSERVEFARAWRLDRLNDSVTGLLSRAGLLEVLAAEHGPGARTPLCVAVLDVDQCSVVRQALGFATGDELLREVATNLQRVVPTGGRLARMPGDAFCVTFHSSDPLDVDRVAAELRDAVRQPVTVRGRTVRITASVGSTLAGPTTGIESALQQAEVAMQEASRRGGNRCVPYAPSMGASQEGLMRLWNALRGALQYRQMEVWFQPVVSLASERPIAAEALCRWHHPQFGDVAPAEFIPIAEQNSEILNIGSFVHGRAAEVMNMLRAGGTGRLGDFHISVNASPNELAWPRYAANLLTRLRANDTRPEWFAVEITEAALTQRDDAVRDNLRQLRDAGVALSLDDFGAGYASLERLRLIPVDRVKIDRRFVATMLENDRSERLVAAVVALADDLRMTTIAEGVETVAQAARLRALGCQAAQGFLYAPAVPDTELPAVLRDLGQVGALPRW